MGGGRDPPDNGLPHWSTGVLEWERDVAMFANAPADTGVPHDLVEGLLVGVTKVTVPGDVYAGQVRTALLPRLHLVQVPGRHILNQVSPGGPWEV